MVSTATAFATDGSHLQRRLESLINPVGYYTLHPDVSLNYQMNRFSTGETDMIDEMRDVAPRIHDYTDYPREFVGLARRALDSGRKLEGAVAAVCRVLHVRRRPEETNHQAHIYPVDG